MNFKTDECIELKNLQYKTMLSGGSLKVETNTTDFNVLDKFLEDNKLHNLNENWTKMDNSTKIKKLTQFADKYIEDNQLTEEVHVKLISFLKESIDQKQLMRVKDVIYDKNTKEIKDIPSLYYNITNQTFYLKTDKNRLHTLKSLPPVKVRGTLKNKNMIPSI
jgi:hypothetical protein